MDVYPLDGQDSLFRLFFMPADTYSAVQNYETTSIFDSFPDLKWSEVK